VAITVWRDGGATSISVEVGKAPERSLAAADEEGNSPVPATDETKVASLGLTLGRLTSDARKELHLGKDVKGALVTDVADGAAAAEQGLQPGDVIVKVGAAAVDGPKQAAQRIEQAKTAKQKSVLVLLNRHGNEHFVALPFERA
jgi:serine protease Do